MQHATCNILRQLACCTSLEKVEYDIVLILVDSQSITLKIFPDQVDSFFNCLNCSFVCLFAPMSHTLYTSNAQSAAFRSALGSPPLKGRGPWQGGRGKQTMQPRFANYGTLCYKLWQFLVESASNADSGNVIL